MLGFASPRVDPVGSSSCLEAWGLLALLVGDLRLENFSQGSLFPGQSVFVGLKMERKIAKHTSLPGFCAPTSTLCQSGTDKPIANSKLMFVFPTLSRSISVLHSSNFLLFS